MITKISVYAILFFLTIILSISILTIASINLKGVKSISPLFPDTTTITIISVGDIFIHQSMLDAVYDMKVKSYDFIPCFQEVAPYLQNVDMATAWFGGVLDSVGPYSGYPSFKTPETFASAMKQAGFDIVFRTNHTMDYGERGLKSTANILKKYDIEQIGAYISRGESENIYIYEKDGIKISFLSYTYGMNDILVPKPWMVNFIDTLKIKEDIKKAKIISGFVIVALHFGIEYQRYPNQEQKQLVRKITQYGADMIIGSHPHVTQPVELLNNKVFVAHSLGNFFCGQRMQYCDVGIMLKYTIAKEKDSIYLKEVKYIPTWTAKYQENDNYKFKILPITKNTQITKENYNFLSDDNINRMKQAFNETIKHIDKPDINFICKD